MQSMLSLRDITVGSDLMSKDKKEKKRKKRMKKVIAYIIAAILIIAFNVLYLSRYFLGVYINYKRNDWETDRNFYAKNIKLDDIEIDKNGSKQIVYSSKKFRKGKANCDEVTMYAKDCQYSYKSDKGKINATMTGNQIHFYPVSFSKEELKKMKIDIWEKCKNKIFVNEYGTDSHNHVIYHDWKKQKVCTNFLIKNNETNTYGKVNGESLITPGKYDRLYPDSDMYSINKVEKYDRKDKMMNEAADLYYNKKGEKSGYFTLYGMILFVFLVLLDLVYTVILGIPLGVLFLIFDW